MEIWDKIMTKFYYFTGDDLANSRRQWFVEDTQISLGWVRHHVLNPSIPSVLLCSQLPDFLNFALSMRASKHQVCPGSVQHCSRTFLTIHHWSADARDLRPTGARSAAEKNVFDRNVFHDFWTISRTGLEPFEVQIGREGGSSPTFKKVLRSIVLIISNGFRTRKPVRHVHTHIHTRTQAKQHQLGWLCLFWKQSCFSTQTEQRTLATPSCTTGTFTPCWPRLRPTTWAGEACMRLDTTCKAPSGPWRGRSRSFRFPSVFCSSSYKFKCQLMNTQ